MSRTRYWYNPETKKVEEYGSHPAVTARVELMTGSMYDNCVATDGTPLTSRAKYQEYMRIHGLTHSSDFKEHWAKAQAQKERMFDGKGDFDHAGRREAIDRAMHEVWEKKR